MTPGYRAPLVVVTVGGDHHPFDRLMGWVEAWLQTQGDRVRCVVQHGPAQPPVGAECYEFLDHEVLLALMSDARAVVSSGGPATLSEARRLGHRPVTVPRLTALGEVVDDHQRAFTNRLHELGLVVQAETPEAFDAAVSAAIDAPRIVISDGDSTTATTIRRVGELVDREALRGSERRQRALPADLARALVRR